MPTKKLENFEVKVIRTCREKGTEEYVSLEYAVQKCDGYWNDSKILLIQGEELFTPYATYKIEKP